MYNEANGNAKDLANDVENKLETIFSNLERKAKVNADLSSSIEERFHEFIVPTPPTPPIADGSKGSQPLATIKFLDRVDRLSSLLDEANSRLSSILDRTKI